MKLVSMWVATVAVAALATPATAAPTERVSKKEIPGQYICAFGSGVAKDNIKAEAKRTADAANGVVLETYTTAYKGFAIKRYARNGTALA